MTPSEFREELRTSTVEEIVQTHIVNDGTGKFVTQLDLESLTRTARLVFRINEQEKLKAVVVGSAKLGFSFLEKPATKDRPFKPAYRSFEPGVSDIDVALVSPVIFGKIWNDLALVGSRMQSFPWRIELASYMLHGWIRPDKFPKEQVGKCEDWRTFFRRVSTSKEFSFKNLRCGLFQSDYFLTLYQCRGVRMAQELERAK